MFYAAEYRNGKPFKVYSFKTEYARMLYIKMHEIKNIHNISPSLAEEYKADKIRYEEF